MRRRVDEFGRAFAGSQLQIQTYVNCRRWQLDAAILNALPELAERGASFEWVSPLAEKRFVEYHDGSFLSALGLQDSAGLLVEFWPQGGPHWDALAKINWNDGTPAGVLLVEAKSYPAEMFSNGCLAGEESLTRIIKSIEATRTWLSASAGNADLDAWTSRLYQFANRLAHLYFLREIAGASAWFVNVCFAHDPHSPTPIKSWEQALESAKAALGLGEISIPFYADVILEAVDRELYQVGATTGGPAPNQVSYAPRKEWRFLRNDRTGRHQFLGFVNARGSSSLRFFDADSGLLLGEPRYGRKQPYENAFAAELSASTPLAGPPVVSNIQIALDQLGTMRSQAGLNPIQRDPSPTASRSSILAGVDTIVDQALGVCQIGRTSPHYRHLTAYRVLATGSRGIDGPALITDMYCRIVRNWPGTRCRGSENWRWEKKTYISEQNDSSEKRFEKGLAAKCGEWYNMIPVASGVMPDVDEGGRRIDLARCYGPGRFEFVELKLGKSCNTPLHAAIEILGYGLIYVFSRKYAHELGYDPENMLLSALEIGLRVLAPSESYSQGSLALFESEVNRGLKALMTAEAAPGLLMDFRFEKFPADFDPMPKLDSLCDVMRRRSPVYSFSSPQEQSGQIESPPQ